MIDSITNRANRPLLADRDEPDWPSEWPFLIAEITRRTWTPRLGSVAGLLMGEVDSRDDWCALRSIRAFAALAVESEGLWWVELLEKDADQITTAEEVWARLTFECFLDGTNPFPKSHAA